MLAYLAGGILVILIMRMLGEMATSSPDTGSFSTYAEKAIGRWAGFTIGWLYWWFWTLLMAWEAYVAGMILHDWFPLVSINVFTALMTALLIVVGVALDTAGQIETHLLTRQYEGFMKKGRIGRRR